MISTKYFYVLVFPIFLFTVSHVKADLTGSTAPVVIGGGLSPVEGIYDPNTGEVSASYENGGVFVEGYYDGSCLDVSGEYCPKQDSVVIDFEGLIDFESGDMGVEIEAALNNYCSGDIGLGCSFIEGEIVGSCHLSLDGTTYSCSGYLNGEGWDISIFIPVGSGSLGNIDFNIEGEWPNIHLPISEDIKILNFHNEDPLNPGHTDPEYGGGIGIGVSY